MNSGDRDRLPPGQSRTIKWPVLHYGNVPRFDRARWDFRVFGLVEREVRLTYDQLTALPRTRIVADIHCVTRWSRLDTRFEGVPRARSSRSPARGPRRSSSTWSASRAYTTNVPLPTSPPGRRALAWHAEPRISTPDHGWPLRLVVPQRYFWKAAKWVRGFELLDGTIGPGSGSTRATTTTPIRGRNSGCEETRPLRGPGAVVGEGGVPVGSWRCAGSCGSVSGSPGASESSGISRWPG